MITFIRKKLYSYSSYQEGTIKISVLDPGYLFTYITSMFMPHNKNNSLRQINWIFYNRDHWTKINMKNRNILSLLFVDIILSLGSTADFNHNHNSYIISKLWQSALGPKLKYFVPYVWRMVLNINVSIVWYSQCPYISKTGKTKSFQN